MSRVLWRLVLFLAVTAPGTALLLFLAHADPLTEGRGAEVGRNAALPSGHADVSVPLRDATNASFWTERDVRVDDGRGGEEIAPFRPWVLRAANLDQVDDGRAIEGRDVRLEMAREPETAEDLRGDIELEAEISSRRARLDRTGQEWTTVLLRDEVELIGRDPQGKRAELRTSSLRCLLLTKRVTSDRVVTIERPGMTLRGTGLDAVVDLGRAELARNIRLEIDLEHADLPWAKPSPEGEAPDENPDENEVRQEEEKPLPPLVVLCGGPLRLEEIEAEPGELRRIRVEALGGVHATREKDNRLDCRALTIVLAVVPAAEEDRETDDEERVVPIFMDVEELRPLRMVSDAGDHVRLTGGRLTWRRRGDEAWEATIPRAPHVVIVPPGKDSALIEISSRGPAMVLVEKERGFAEAVFRDAVRAARDDEVLTANETTVTRRRNSRTLTARGDPSIESKTLSARAEILGRTEEKDGTVLTVLTGRPRVVLRGRGGLGLFGARRDRKRRGSDTETNPPEKPDETETELRSEAPIVLVEKKKTASATAGSGVVVIRRDGDRELGRVEALEADVTVSRGKEPDLVSADLVGPVRATGKSADGDRLDVTAGHLAYRMEDRTLRLTRDRPMIRLVDREDEDETGVTFLRADSLDWNRATGEFDAKGPVEAQLAGGIDLLAPLQPAAEADEDEPHGLTCERLRGRLLVDEATGKVDLRSARADGTVLIQGPAGLARGDLLVLEALETGYRGRITGRPARIERVLPDERRDIFEGPALHVEAGDEKEPRGLRAPDGGTARIHLPPRDEKGTLVRLDLASDGSVVLDPERLDAPAGVRLEHRAWNEKKKAWNPPLRLSGRTLTGTFVEVEDEEGKPKRRVESLNLVGDVVVRPEDGSRLTCARASLDPVKEEIRLEGSPWLEYVLPSGKILRARWARYRYRPDVEGTKMVVSRFVSPRDGGR